MGFEENEEQDQKPFNKEEYLNSRCAALQSGMDASLGAMYDLLTHNEEQPLLNFAKPAEVADFVKQLEALKDSVKQLKADCETLLEWFKKGVLPEYFEGLDITSMKVDGKTGRWQLVLMPDMYVNIPAGNREAVYDWLRENGSGDLITETVNAGTFGAFVKSAFRDGRPYPEDLIKATPYSYVQVKKG